MKTSQVKFEHHKLIVFFNYSVEIGSCSACTLNDAEVLKSQQNYEKNCDETKKIFGARIEINFFLYNN